MKLSLFFILAALNLGFLESVISAKPGSEARLNVKELNVTLFVSAIHVTTKSAPTATFVWIPADLEKICIGKEFAHCAEAANCRMFPEEQTCEDYDKLIGCKTQTRPTCLKLGLKKPGKKNDRSPPLNTLQSTPASIPTSIAKKLRLWLGKDDFTGTKGLEQVSKKYSVKAKVRWEEWSNGENFEILEFL